MLSDLKNIRIEDYDYPLPDDRIARHPAELRDHSRLLCLRGDQLSEHRFFDLPDLLPPGAELYFNDTRVIHARLFFRKATGANIEVFCLEPHGMALTEAFEQRSQCEWNCLIGNNKRWREGALSGQWQSPAGPFALSVERVAPAGDAWVVRFSWTGGMSFAEVIEHAGVIPLPPYMGREAEADDNLRYQTIFARRDGSVAAPTAALHFTPELIESLAARGITTQRLTLHVGAGTFRPVASDTIGEHPMHTEYIAVRRHTLERLLAHNCEVIAVGTTSVRTLESLYYMGLKVMQDPDIAEDQLHVNQWEPYGDGSTVNASLSQMAPSPIPSTCDAIRALLDWMLRKELTVLHSSTQIIIAPGYTYHIVKMLITNFHQPQSTLLLLVSAFVKGDWHKIYDYALAHDFRFLSYGDSSLLIP